MKHTEFNQLKQTITELSPKQKSALEKLLLHPDPQPEIVKLMEQELHGCPHCQHKDAYRWGTTNGRQRYRCKSCEKTYNTLTGTELSSLYKTELWEQYCETMVESKSLRVAAKECGINLTTAFRWRHKFLKLADSLMSNKLERIVEMDETYFKYSEKGSRHLTAEKARKRVSDKAPKIKAVIGIDRSGHIADHVVSHFTLAQLKADFYLNSLMIWFFAPTAISIMSTWLSKKNQSRGVKPKSWRACQRQGFPHPNRQCIPHAVEAMVGSISWCCNQKSPQIFGLVSVV